MNDTKLARRRRDLVWWRGQAERVERHREGMKWVPLVGLPLAAVGALVHPLLGAAAIALTALIGLMGLYMTSVRVLEMRGHILSCEEELGALESEAREASRRPEAGAAP